MRREYDFECRDFAALEKWARAHGRLGYGLDLISVGDMLQIAADPLPELDVIDCSLLCHGPTAGVDSKIGPGGALRQPVDTYKVPERIPALRRALGLRDEQPLLRCKNRFGTTYWAIRGVFEPLGAPVMVVESEVAGRFAAYVFALDSNMQPPWEAGCRRSWLLRKRPQCFLGRVRHGLGSVPEAIIKLLYRSAGGR